MRQRYVTTEPSVYAEVDSDWTSIRPRRLHNPPLVQRLPPRSVGEPTIRRREAPVRKCHRPLRRPRWPVNYLPFRRTVKCRLDRPAAPEGRHPLEMRRRFRATTAVDLACAWAAKRTKSRPVRPISNRKSAKARAVTYTDPLSTRPLRHRSRRSLPLQVLVRAGAIQPCRPKRPNSKTGSDARITTR